MASEITFSWLVQPGTVTGSLLTGMLGLQPQPTVGEALVYLLYAVPMTLYVLWPDRLRPRRRTAPAGKQRATAEGRPAAAQSPA